MQQLLEQALPPADSDNDPLYLVALAVERDAALGQDMGEREAATVGDGMLTRAGAALSREDLRAVEDGVRAVLRL